MTSASAPSLTIGMQIDAFLSNLESIPSTHLYIVVIAVSIVFSFLLLNSGRGSSMAMAMPDSERVVVKPSVGHKKKAKEGNNSDEPQPKWHILKITNYVATTAFFISVIQFASDATAYLNDSNALLSFLVIWSLLLCYFFGFFGISFVELDDFVKSIPAGEQVLVDARGKPNNIQCSPDPPVKVVNIHAPATSAPVCTDPASFKRSSSSTIPANLQELSDHDIATLVIEDTIKDHQLEKLLDPHRAVTVRRLKFNALLETLGRGMIWITSASLGLIAKLLWVCSHSRGNGGTCDVEWRECVHSHGYYGGLVASTNRGCKAISQGSGAISTIVGDGITRAPCIRLPSAQEAASVLLWIKEPANFLKLKESFESTTSFGKLIEASPTVAGRNVYLRLRCFSGDAMGMNMISKGSLAVIECLKAHFPNISLVALSGNMCTDKKAAAVNWIEGRGKSVVIEATIPKEVVRSTLKTSVPAIVETNINKNLIGSAMAGVVGGFNAHAANNVTAVFLATGQDPAQNVESANCISLMEETPEGDLWISCTMPSIEVGTVGGGTGLPAQASCLKVIGAKGGGVNPGDNARQLAHVVAAAVMAGELSLMAALASNSLVAAHMAHNRKPVSK
ncbi:hypothetical protein HJC23_011180 [Cyclotella cryptica]|uniref:hydroxymethylglutaryl-CoA reductase (NADPH) n=1 Tax=Cyclotella cryptica TaxID=29204 RepID=A0ABD3PB67_9STRA